MAWVHFSSRTSGSGWPAAWATAISLAKAQAPASRSSPTMRSNSFWPGTPASISLFTASPLTIMFSAVSTPSTRGRRWVPPAPGMRPILTSGSATLVPGAAMR